MTTSRPRALLIDLNNFARYPSLAVGYIVAALRRAEIDVEVLAPLNHGVPGTERERAATARDYVQRRLYFSTHPVLTSVHDAGRAAVAARRQRPHPHVLQLTREAIARLRPDVILLSAYTDHYPSVQAVSGLAADHRIPLLLGGPVFNVPQIARAWTHLRGITAIVGAEVDFTLPEIVQALVAGRPLTTFRGVFLPDGTETPPAPPLADLDGLPIPDFTDFPWSKYPVPVIPIMTGRGCSWGRCTFCSDVITANGRGYRTRPVEQVFAELEHQARTHSTRDVLFHDIKLNSDLVMWRSLIEQMPQRMPGSRWTATVHVAAEGDNGLSRRDLVAAGKAGCIRMTFGLESGSQRSNDRMAKGTSIERMSEVLRDGHAAGISMRLTTMVGYPGETVADLQQTERFLEDHAPFIDRVNMSLFKSSPGTRFYEMHEKNPETFNLKKMVWDYRYARGAMVHTPFAARDYRRARARLMKLVHTISSRPLRPEAQAFEGLM
jgi:radical SAM superfamily enzyme YgiQ (UPF0313 family)